MEMTQRTLQFHDLYERYAIDVYRFSFWLAGNATDAEDITAETFMRAWASRRKIRTETVRAYLFVIARNEYLQMQRRVQREVKLETAPHITAPGPDDLIADRLALQKVADDLQTLSETDRTALLLRAHHEMPYVEIARVLQISVSAAKVKVHRARLKLASLQPLEEVP